MGVVAGVLAVLSLTKPMWGENLPVDPSVASFLHVLVWFVPPAIAFLFGLFDGKEDGFTWWVPMIGMAIFFALELVLRSDAAWINTLTFGAGDYAGEWVGSRIRKGGKRKSAHDVPVRR